jgi:uncharacterized protein (TIGR03067 family)
MAVGIIQAGGEKKAGLQGTWEAEKDGKKLTLTFAKKEFTVIMNGEKVTGTFKTDGKKNPKEIDMSVVDAEGQHAAYKGKTSLGIYELKGDTLRWCAAEPGMDRRPTEFTNSQGDAKFMLVELKRKK